MRREKLSGNQDGMARWVLILIIVLSVLVVGGVGYIIGWNRAEDQAKTKYAKQIQQIQTDLNKATQNATNKAAAGKEKVSQGQQTVEQLQAENSQLKSTIDQQSKRIADLEKQLADAQKNSSTTPPTNQ